MLAPQVGRYSKKKLLFLFLVLKIGYIYFGRYLIFNIRNYASILNIDILIFFNNRKPWWYISIQTVVTIFTDIINGWTDAAGDIWCSKLMLKNQKLGNQKSKFSNFNRISAYIVLLNTSYGTIGTYTFYFVLIFLIFLTIIFNGNDIFQLIVIY